MDRVEIGDHLPHGVITAEEAGVGFGPAHLSGVAVGALVAEIRVIDEATYPLTAISRRRCRSSFFASRPSLDRLRRIAIPYDGTATAALRK